MSKRTYLVVDDQRIEMTNALVGGVMVDRDKTPFSVYSGTIDVSDVGVSLLNVFRCVIKINKEEHQLSLEDSKDYILFTLREAIRLETEKRSDYHKAYNMDNLVKKYMDNQF